MIVDSNSPAPLKYTDPTFQAGPLNVQANIYDISGVSPSLVAQVQLAALGQGTYATKYQFEAGKQYIVQKLVYTDNVAPFQNVDQTFAQDNDDVQCVDLNGTVYNSVNAPTDFEVTQPQVADFEAVNQ